MGVCTRALLKGKIRPEEIANFILHHYNLEPNQIRVQDIFTDSIKLENKLKPIKQYGNNKEYWNTDSTHIVFINPFDKKRFRSLFVYYSNCVFKDNDDSHITSQYETTYISLGHDEDAIEIIKAITSYFGGWMDVHDCDDTDYIEVVPEGSEVKNEGIKPIFYFTIEELQEHFDGIVKIVSKAEKEKLVRKKIALKKLTPKIKEDNNYEG